MFEVMQHPEDIEQWQLAAEGGTPDWQELFAGYEAGDVLVMTMPSDGVPRGARTDAARR